MWCGKRAGCAARVGRGSRAHLDFVHLAVPGAVGGEDHEPSVGRKARVRVGVLQGTDLPLALYEILVVVGTMVGVPVRADVARARLAQQPRFPGAVVRVEEHEAAVGEGGVADHAVAAAVDRRMPGVEAADGAHGAAVDVDADDPVGPARGQQLAAVRHPALVHDPLVAPALVGEAVAAAVAVDHPEAVAVGAGVAQQPGVSGVKLRLRDPPLLLAEDGLVPSRAGVDDDEVVDPAARRRAFLRRHGHRPPAVVAAEGADPRRRRPGFDPVDPGEGEEPFLALRLALDAPQAVRGGVVDEAAVVRRVEGPLRQAAALGELDEDALVPELGEQLRRTGAVRHEQEPPHPVVVGRHTMEGVMVYRGVCGHLPDGGAGPGVR